MAGGLLNLIAYGQQNIILNGNPSKTFFKTTYVKYTNFGLQKFRLDFEGQRSLRLTEDSKFTFKVPRYADLLMDTYLVITLPTIWSPIYPPQTCESKWIEYGFKWIKNLGSQLIKEIHISVGGQTLGKFSGQYLYNLVERDFSSIKKELFYKMTGNVVELNDPAKAYENGNKYPNAYYNGDIRGPAPSIYARKLYIPINAWFTLNSKMAFPLVSLQYNELYIDVTLRPIQELFTIKDIGDENNLYPYVRPDFNNPLQGFYRFLQPPPTTLLNDSDYVDKRTNWNADIHLISTYAFLSEEEVKLFALLSQQYLIRDVHEYKFNNIAGSNRVKLDSLGMVSNWMWYFQRNDVYLRNEWSNYTNWPYDNLPYPIIDAASIVTAKIVNPCAGNVSIGPDRNPKPGQKTGFNITQTYNPQNEKSMLKNLGILLDGKYRENVFDSGIYDYIEKYTRTAGNSPDGLYCYNFCINTNPFDTQPGGALNMSMFNIIELEFTTVIPAVDPKAAFYQICDPVTKEVVGVNKSNWQIYNYNIDLTIMEERYNILRFVSGNAGLEYAR